MDESRDEIYKLISQIEQAKTIRERKVIAKQLLTHFTFYVGEVNDALSVEEQEFDEDEVLFINGF